jgi:hypothetical protein
MFDERGLALLFDDDPQSKFHKFIYHEELEEPAPG